MGEIDLASEQGLYEMGKDRSRTLRKTDKPRKGTRSKGDMKPRYFTHYWRGATLNHYRASGDTSLECIADNKFIKRGVRHGDVVYPVSISGGSLYLIGRLEVERVCRRREVEEFLGYEPSWQASDYLIAAESTSKHFDLEVPPEVTRELRVMVGENVRQLKFVSPDHLDQQTLRGVRELTVDSASSLDRLLTHTSRDVFRG